MNLGPINIRMANYEKWLEIGLDDFQEWCENGGGQIKETEKEPLTRYEGTYGYYVSAVCEKPGEITEYEERQTEAESFGPKVTRNGETLFTDGIRFGEDDGIQIANSDGEFRL